MIIENAFRVRDLEDPSLCIIPKKDLEIPVRVSRVFGGDITPRFEDNKTPIPTDIAGNRLGHGIGKLPDDRVNLPPYGKADRKKRYNY